MCCQQRFRISDKLIRVVKHVHAQFFDLLFCFYCNSDFENLNFIKLDVEEARKSRHKSVREISELLFILVALIKQFGKMYQQTRLCQPNSECYHSRSAWISACLYYSEFVIFSNSTNSDLAGEENEMLDFCFTTFTHVTSFFGYRKRDRNLLTYRII